jgi:hypothetical protein
LAVLLAAGPVYGQEVKLQWKFKEGDKFWVEEITAHKQNVTILGMDQKSNTKTTTIRSIAVNKVTPDSVEITMRIDDVKVESEGGLGGDLDKLMEKTKGASLTITMTPEGKVKKVDGFDAFFKQVIAGIGAQDEISQLLKEMIKEETFTKGVEHSFALVPEKAVKKGDTWTRQMTFPLGPLGDLKSNYEFSYDGKADGGDKIDFKQSLQYVPPKGDFAGLFKVTKGNLKAEQSKGTAIFDGNKGRLVNSSEMMVVRGTLTLDAAGQEAALDLTMEINTTSRVLDQDPAKK